MTLCTCGVHAGRLHDGPEEQPLHRILLRPRQDLRGGRRTGNTGASFAELAQVLCLLYLNRRPLRRPHTATGTPPRQWGFRVFRLAINQGILPLPVSAGQTSLFRLWPCCPRHLLVRT